MIRGGSYCESALHTEMVNIELLCVDNELLAETNDSAFAICNRQKESFTDSGTLLELSRRITAHNRTVAGSWEG